jgi:light-regulated signal transduction histidine kinase (bacteriophytochrome)
VELVYELQRRSPSDPSQPRGLYQVLHTGQPEFHPEISEDMLMNSLNEEQFNLIRDLGVKSVITMPIMSRDQALGVISFVMAESNRHYSQADLELTNQLANRAALAVDNARLYHGATKLNDELEQRVINRTAELEVANKELAAFSYSVSHDLRSPLRSIDGFSQALLEDYHDSLNKEAQNYLERIRTASQRMAQLIDDLLMLSRMTRSHMHRERVNLSEQAQLIVNELQEIEPDRQVTWTITPGITVEADRQLIWAVLENLLGNAWKFTGKRSAAHIEFGVTRQPDEEQVYFVQDNGAGFDMTYAEKMFGAFQRLHSLAEFPGTGIGLATVQRIIHRHGGRIWAEGEVDEGATFYFTLNSG